MQAVTQDNSAWISSMGRHNGYQWKEAGGKQRWCTNCGLKSSNS